MRRGMGDEEKESDAEKGVDEKRESDGERDEK